MAMFETPSSLAISVCFISSNNTFLRSSHWLINCRYIVSSWKTKLYFWFTRNSGAQESRRKMGTAWKNIFPQPVASRLDPQTTSKYHSWYFSFGTYSPKSLLRYIPKGASFFVLSKSDGILWTHIPLSNTAFITAFLAWRSNENQIFGLGYIQRIKVRHDAVRIYPQIICCLPQQKLNEACFELDMGGDSYFNELNRTHWSIKKIDLLAGTWCTINRASGFS